MLKPLIWIICDPKAGTLSQAVGLADRLGGANRIIEARARLPWRWLPPGWWIGARHALSEPLTGPGAGPRLVIAAGRSAVAPAASLRGPGCTVVALLNPRMDPAAFDLVICPQHDRLTGPNVLPTLGVLHRLTPERIADEAALWRERLSALPIPRIAVLVGGDSRHLRLTLARAAEIGATLAELARSSGGSLIVTTSRRTSPAATAALRQALEGVPQYFHDGSGDNPYPALLGIADHVLVTEDSTSMISEAVSSGRPVHLLRLEGNPGKFVRFQQALYDGGYARAFDGSLPVWVPPSLDETGRAARAVVGLLIGPENPHVPPSRQ